MRAGKSVDAHAFANPDAHPDRRHPCNGNSNPVADADADRNGNPNSDTDPN